MFGVFVIKCKATPTQVMSVSSKCSVQYFTFVLGYADVTCRAHKEHADVGRIIVAHE